AAMRRLPRECSRAPPPPSVPDSRTQGSPRGRQERASLGGPACALPEASEARGGAQLEALGLREDEAAPCTSLRAAVATPARSGDGGAGPADADATAPRSLRAAPRALRARRPAGGRHLPRLPQRVRGRRPGALPGPLPARDVRGAPGRVRVVARHASARAVLRRDRGRGAGGRTRHPARRLPVREVRAALALPPCHHATAAGPHRVALPRR